MLDKEVWSNVFNNSLLRNRIFTSIRLFHQEYQKHFLLSTYCFDDVQLIYKYNQLTLSCCNKLGYSDMFDRILAEYPLPQHRSKIIERFAIHQKNPPVSKPTANHRPMVLKETDISKTPYYQSSGSQSIQRLHNQHPSWIEIAILKKQPNMACHMVEIMNRLHPELVPSFNWDFLFLLARRNSFHQFITYVLEFNFKSSAMLFDQQMLALAISTSTINSVLHYWEKHYSKKEEVMSLELQVTMINTIIELGEVDLLKSILLKYIQPTLNNNNQNNNNNNESNSNDSILEQFIQHCGENNNLSIYCPGNLEMAKYIISIQVEKQAILTKIIEDASLKNKMDILEYYLQQEPPIQISLEPIINSISNNKLDLVLNRMMSRYDGKSLNEQSTYSSIVLFPIKSIYHRKGNYDNDDETRFNTFRELLKRFDYGDGNSLVYNLLHFQYENLSIMDRNNSTKTFLEWVWNYIIKIEWFDVVEYFIDSNVPGFTSECFKFLCGSKGTLEMVKRVFNKYGSELITQDTLRNCIDLDIVNYIHGKSGLQFNITNSFSDPWKCSEEIKLFMLKNDMIAKECLSNPSKTYLEFLNMEHYQAAEYIRSNYYKDVNQLPMYALNSHGHDNYAKCGTLNYLYQLQSKDSTLFPNLTWIPIVEDDDEYFVDEDEYNNNNDDNGSAVGLWSCYKYDYVTEDAQTILDTISISGQQPPQQLIKALLRRSLASRDYKEVDCIMRSQWINSIDLTMTDGPDFNYLDGFIKMDQIHYVKMVVNQCTKRNMYGPLVVSLGMAYKMGLIEIFEYLYEVCASNPEQMKQDQNLELLRTISKSLPLSINTSYLYAKYIYQFSENK